MVSTKWVPSTPCTDGDPGQQGPCVAAAMNKFTGTTEVLWRKRDSTATLSVREGERAPALPGQAFIAFLGALH